MFPADRTSNLGTYTLPTDICRQRVYGRRPRGRTPPVSVVPSRNCHAEHPQPLRGRNLRTCHGFHRHVSVVTRIPAGPGPRQQLDRFQPVLKLHRRGAFEMLGQISGERHPGHLCPVAVIVVATPPGLDGVLIAGLECRT